ncbi:LutC/YkgG family protein [Paenibacillus roseipurpureus]|uniref:LUD domain-containing protein n=1 Tax=Paenibacillus roseopurpureus TaxID=2918901 RepID=A0AA96RKY4_9BACL|nr:LUD domain-containing protein [Paenibacillus sp. MBLB1832]WNR45200.1 LUD domain-containing protein [Paenibacillus sp. MBLB1832]
MAKREITPDWQEKLMKLDQQSLADQESFMQSIAQKLGRPRVIDKPAHPFQGASDSWKAFEWTPEERVANFTANFQAAGGHVVKVASMEEAKTTITELVETLSVKRIIHQDQAELHSLELAEALPEVDLAVWNTDEDTNWKASAANADLGIVLADYAAAYTGSLTVLSSKEKGRSVSLLPGALIVLLPIERLKTRLGEILAPIDLIARKDLPAGIHFISGPSRSADIENDLTIGVHGPGIVHVLLIG